MNTTIRAVSIAISVTGALFLATSQTEAAAPATPQGFITFRTFAGDQRPGIRAGTAIPDGTFYPKRMEGPYNGYPGDDPGDDTTLPVDIRENYNMDLIGYFYPPKTGKIQFAICTDDPGELWLSTDDTPAHKVQIASESQWNPKRGFGGAWDPTTVPPTATRRSIITTGDPPIPRPENWSPYIQVTQGKPYFIEAIGTEFGGGDNTAVAFRYEGDPDFMDGDLPILGQYLSTIDKTLGPVSIATQPQSLTVQEGTSATLKVAADGTPPYSYQWKKGGTDVTDATNATYYIQFTSATDSGQYTVTVSGGQGSPVTSSAATLTVQADTTKPTIVSASGSGDFKHLTVTYSERIDPASGTNAANYGISGGVTVSDGRFLSDTVVYLTTSTQTGGTVYTLTVNNVKDRAATANTIAPNTTITFNSAVFKTGIANWERFRAVDGDTADIDAFVANLSDPTFRGPDVIGISSYLGSPRNVEDNYGNRASAYFVPPANGNYVFFMACDDHGYLFLSTDDNPANKKKIAAQPAWSDQNQWIDPDLDRTMGLGVNASDQFDASEWPTGNTITLVKGNKYYIELDFQEGGGGDGSECYYKLASDPDPANGTASDMTGAVIGTYVDPGVLPPVITNRPSGVVYSKGDTLTFTVGVDSVKPVTYQWYRSKIAIQGATNATLTIPNADHTAVGDYYVDVTSVNGTASSFPDDTSRAIMKGAFLIEAEDFNFGSGQTKPEASVMPYMGNAYTNLTTAVNDVDFFNTADESGGAAFAYSRFDVASPPDAVVDMKGGAASEGADAIQNAINRLRGEWSVTANYAVGWTDKGEWQNYTRTFPAGNYVIIGGLAYDGRAADQLDQYISVVADPTKPDGSGPGTEGGQQGLTRVGVFKAPATGAWSSNDLIPLRDGSGNYAQVQLSGTKTLRWTANKGDGDQDFLLLYNIGGGGGGPNISVSRDATGKPVITYTGILQSATDLPGTFQPVANATSPYTVDTAAGARRFYRAASQ